VNRRTRAGGAVDGPGSPLLAFSGAVAADGADTGVARHYGDPFAEQRALADGRAVTDLSHRGVVRITGADRLRLVHVGTTWSLRSLAPGESVEALMLSPQGWIEHELHLVDDGRATWATVEPRGVAGLLGRLRRAATDRDVIVEDMSDLVAVLGERASSPVASDVVAVWDDPWPSVVPGSESLAVVTGSEHPGTGRRWREVLVPRRELTERVGGRPLAGSWAGEALRIEAWRPRADTEAGDHVFARELDWQRTAVHRDPAGPVPGRGRRRLVMLHLDGSGSELPAVAAEVLHGTCGVGRVTSVVLHWELGPVALALVRGSTPPEAVLRVDGVPAAQELIVSPG
jgi:folate-binding Fe-S cluster repair protein YgfZ